MFKFKQKPYNVLLLAGLLMVLISCFVLNNDNSVDIHLHDTYFIIARSHVFWLFAIILFILWILYLITHRILYSKALSWTHLIITILTLALSVFALFFSNNPSNQMPRRYYDYSNSQSFDTYQTVTMTIAFTIAILLLGQIVFVVNVIAGVIKRGLNSS